MDEYYLLGTLSNYITQINNNYLKKYWDKYNVNYSLLYPLSAIEIGCMREFPHSTENLLKRCVAGYIYSQAKNNSKEITLKAFDRRGFEKYLKLYDSFLLPLYQNYRFAREINDINHLTKARLIEENKGKYVLTTSFVTDKYKEENFYFYGVDEPYIAQLEAKQLETLNILFYKKIFFESQNITRLVENIDMELYKLCTEAIEKDLKKWQSNVKSLVFSYPRQLSLVIGYLYYQAVLTKISYHISAQCGEKIHDLAPQTIMKMNKEDTINKIITISNLKRTQVEKIVNYLINEGNLNVLEFPLFEVENELITIPSLIIANDWSFTIINGHYTKNINITNREKTISTITENRLENYLDSVDNVAVAKVKQYSFIDKDGVENASDIDYAIYDMTHNMILIIEAKWIDKHYFDEIDIRYGKVLETFNKIYSKQISKHKKFLSKIENIELLFENDTKFKLTDSKPEIKYLAVDKRNQLHVESNHMISEYMLIFFLKKYTSNGVLNLPLFWQEIDSMETKVEYIKTTDLYHKIDISEKETICVEKNDVVLDLKC